jgi:cell division protein FtsQ
LALVAVAAWWVTHSRIFEVRTIHVRGNVHLSEPDVLRLAKLSSSTNVLWFSPGTVVHRLEGNPWIRSASVSRTLPSSISVSITERSAVAVLDADHHYLIAGDGTILGVVGSATALPVIPGPDHAVVGSSISPAEPALQAVAALRNDLRAQVQRVTIDRDADGMVLELRGGARAVFGDDTDLASKAEALAAVLRWAGRSGVTPATIDLRAPSLPALLPASTG